MSYVTLNTPYMPLVTVPRIGTTLDGFRDWLYSADFPERGRIAFVRGTLIIETGPQPIYTHNQVEVEINHVIPGIARKSNLGEFFPARARLTNLAAEISCQPDGIFASWETFQSGKLGPPRDRSIGDDYIELVGTPDWVCEIVSDSSVEKDARLLVHAYHRARVREYWLIDARGNDVIFRILTWTESAYRTASPRDGWHASPVFGHEFQLTRSRSEGGHWNYELQYRQV